MKKLLLFLLLSAPLFAAQHSATITATDTDFSSTSVYNVYRLSSACPATAPTTVGTGGFTKIGSASAGVNSYTDSTVVVGGSYCYYATIVVNSLESAPSNDAQFICIPAVPTIVISGQ